MCNICFTYEFLFRNPLVKMYYSEHFSNEQFYIHYFLLSYNIPHLPERKRFFHLNLQVFCMFHIFLQFTNLTLDYLAMTLK